MEVRLEQVGKRFNRQWLYTDLSALIPAGSSCAVIGPNGSGKSTLLQLIYQYMLPTKGKASVYMDGLLLEHEMLIRHTAFVAPYLELPEELTLSELMRFHFKIRGHALPDMEKIIHACGLSGNEDKQVRYFSSGMKQRLKLALAFFTGCKLLLLDEPCSNLDSAGIAWYQKMIGDAKGKCTIVVASNQSEEYAFCDKVIHIRNEIS